MFSAGLICCPSFSVDLRGFEYGLDAMHTSVPDVNSKSYWHVCCYQLLTIICDLPVNTIESNGTVVAEGS